MIAVRARLASLFTPWVWRRPARAARLLERFELAEASSMLDLLAAARLTPSVERRAQYLRHALDEDRHARTFSRRARELRAEARLPPRGIAVADFDALYERLGELDFLAFVHRGELRGLQQFSAHVAELGRRNDARDLALFRAILDDEAHHAEYTGTLLRELAGNERAARRALRRVGRRELWWGWRRAGRAIAGAVFLAVTALLYILVAPLALGYRLLRRSPRGWLPPPQRQAG